MRSTRILPNVTRFYLVLPSFFWLYRNCPNDERGCTEFYCFFVSLSFIKSTTDVFILQMIRVTRIDFLSISTLFRWFFYRVSLRKHETPQALPSSYRVFLTTDGSDISGRVDRKTSIEGYLVCYRVCLFVRLLFNSSSGGEIKRSTNQREKRKSRPTSRRTSPISRQSAGADAVRWLTPTPGGARRRRRRWDRRRPFRSLSALFFCNDFISIFVSCVFFFSLPRDNGISTGSFFYNFNWISSYVTEFL